MSDYCECCANNVQHIADHYDPSALTRGDEDPETVLQIFRNCNFGDGKECPLTLEDVREYIESQKEGDC